MGDFGRPPPDCENMVSLKVDNLSYRTTTRDLLEEFSRFGEVGDVYIPKDRFTKESRGFAFVRFYEKRDADDAMDEMDGKMFDHRELRVHQAKYGRPSRPPPRGGRFGGDRGGYDDRSSRRGRSRSRSPRRRRSRSRSPRRRSPSKSRSPSPRRSQERERSRSRDRD